MKASTIFPILLATLPSTLATAAPATDYQNSVTCAARNPSINAAISAFCNPEAASNNLFVPSPDASAGKTSGTAKVSIGGICSPKQWVPVQYCSSQFHAICAAGGSQRRFGRGGCQVWKIETGAANVAGVFKGQ